MVLKQRETYIMCLLGQVGSINDGLVDDFFDARWQPACEQVTANLNMTGGWQPSG